MGSAAFAERAPRAALNSPLGPPPLPGSATAVASTTSAAIANAIPISGRRLLRTEEVYARRCAHATVLLSQPRPAYGTSEMSLLASFESTPPSFTLNATVFDAVGLPFVVLNVTDLRAVW